MSDRVLVTFDNRVLCNECSGTGINPLGGWCQCCDEGAIDVLETVDAEDARPDSLGG